jgi:integrase
MELGENPKIVAERLGHTSIKTTLDTYSHVTPNMQKETARKFGEAILKGNG